jgi:ABC-2 type transport system permease protein
MSDSKLSQWHILKTDKWLLSCLTWVPIVLALTIWWIFSQGIAQNLPIAVVDLQHSTLSRQLTRDLDATESLSVIQTSADIATAKSNFVGNKIYGYMVIPKNFDRDIYLGRAPQVTVFYNSQFILVGKLINKAAQQVVGTFDAKIGTLKQLSKGNSTIQNALAKTVTIRTQITPLFNKNSNYAQFLVSGIVPALWQISIVVSSILVLAANMRIYGRKKIFLEKPFYNLMTINIFYLPFFLMHGLAFLLWFYFNLDWPIFGHLLPLLFAQLITTLACIIMGNLFFLISFHPTRAMSFAAAYTAPSFAFMGVTFPATDMGNLATIWRNLLPISHYIEAQIGQVSYGVSAWETIRKFMPTMFYYLIPLLLIGLIIKKQARKIREDNDAI